jgi:dihydroneopterin aldolase
MDKLRMADIQFYGYHGVFLEENKLGQTFFVSLEAELDLSRAGQTDDLAATVNYAELYDVIKEIVEGPPFKLIEAVAETIATQVLAQFTFIDTITVQVKKPNPPFAIQFAGVTVEVTRRRQQ